VAGVVRYELCDNNTTTRQHDNTINMNCERQEWIDSYLFGELEGQERRRFETQYATDEAFRAEVDLQAEIMVGINSYCSDEEKIQPTKIISMQNIRKIFIATAAAIAFFLMVQITLTNISTPQQMIAQQTANETRVIKDNLNDFEETKPIRPRHPIYLRLAYVALSFS